MRIVKAVGPHAGAIKYDILTALGVHACAQGKELQRLALRLITLIVARYNWTIDSLTVGQREIAALWSIDERSVKREMAKLRALGWLEVKRPAARGRVAEYGLGLAAIMAATRADWMRVGPDFASRLSGPEVDPNPVSNIIAFPALAAGQGVWAQVQTLLHSRDPHLYRSWFAAITAEPPQDGILRLNAPSRFHATYLSTNHAVTLLRLASGCDASIHRVEILGPNPSET